MSQITNHIMMVRPSNFFFNAQTAANDFFQKNMGGSPQQVEAQAQSEFDGFVATLRQAGVTVTVLQDDGSVYQTPDSIFPNNWFVSLDNDTLVLCPMFAEDRRTERLKFLGGLVAALGKDNLKIVDYTRYEKNGRFLEGTGAMVLDRVNRKAFACLSQRCDEGLFRQFCADFDYTPVPFHGYQTYQGKRVAIYHTNVMMAITEKLAIVCLSAIDDPTERDTVVKELTECGKEIVDVSEAEIDHFAGNEIEVMGSSGPYTVMTESTFEVLTEEQKQTIAAHSSILVGKVSTIEQYGGGSVRCMISELF